MENIDRAIYYFKRLRAGRTNPGLAIFKSAQAYVLTADELRVEMSRRAAIRRQRLAAERKLATEQLNLI